MGMLSRWARAVERYIRLFATAFLRLFRLVVWYEAARKWWLGYGERPFQVLAVLAGVVGVTTVLYWPFGTFVLNPDMSPPTIGHPPWSHALYFSLASVSALGYGSWMPEPLGWARWLGAVEPFFGIISAVALSITLTQRIAR